MDLKQFLKETLEELESDLKLLNPEPYETQKRNHGSDILHRFETWETDGLWSCLYSNDNPDLGVLFKVGPFKDPYDTTKPITHINSEEEALELLLREVIRYALIGGPTIDRLNSVKHKIHQLKSK